MSGDQLPKPDARDLMKVGDGPHLSIGRLMTQLVEQAGPDSVCPASPRTALGRQPHDR
jgi:hypothetical protein